MSTGLTVDATLATDEYVYKLNYMKLLSSPSLPHILPQSHRAAKVVLSSLLESTPQHYLSHHQLPRQQHILLINTHKREHTKLIDRFERNQKRTATTSPSLIISVRGNFPFNCVVFLSFPLFVRSKTN